MTPMPESSQEGKAMTDAEIDLIEHACTNPGSGQRASIYATKLLCAQAREANALRADLAKTQTTLRLAEDAKDLKWAAKVSELEADLAKMKAALERAAKVAACLDGMHFENGDTMSAEAQRGVASALNQEIIEALAQLNSGASQ